MTSETPPKASGPPHIEILTIGDELLRGDLVDGNAAWMGATLHAAGLPVARSSSVGDPLGDLVTMFREVLRRARVVVCSGGLGPTDDDRTIEALARAAGRELVLDQSALAHIQTIFDRMGYSYTPNNESQAWVPEGARVLLNSQGTAPGVHLSVDGCDVFCLPGVPREMRGLFGRYISPWLQETFGLLGPERRTLKLFGIGESRVDHRLAGLWQESPLRSGAEAAGVELSIHYRATFPEIHVTFLARPASEEGREQAAQVASHVADAAYERLETHVFARSEGEERSPSLGDALVKALQEAEASVAFAESCTGGRVGDRLTNAAGASEVFELGVVAYANAIKARVLGVSEALLEEHGAVSRQCVEAMAQGARRLAGATYGVAISGIAGPGGGSADKPVGTIHFALDSAAGTRHLHRVFPYDRERNKDLAAHVALWLLLRDLRGLSGPAGDDDPFDGRWGAPRQQPRDPKQNSER